MSNVIKMVFAIETVDGQRVVVIRNRQGYCVCPILLWTAIDATQSRQETSAALAGSMFGWDCPGADPTTYDETGRPYGKHNPKKPLLGEITFTFNSHRPYQPAGHPFAGQVIEVELVKGYANIIKFRDRSRGLDGAFFFIHAGHSNKQLEAVVMRRYDTNDYTIGIDYFEHQLAKGMFDTLPIVDG